MDYIILVIGLVAIIAIFIVWIAMAYRRMTMSKNTVDQEWKKVRNAIADRFDILEQIREYADASNDEGLSKSALRSMNAYSQAYKANDPAKAGRAEKLFTSDTVKRLANSIKQSDAMASTKKLRIDLADNDKVIKRTRRDYNEVALKHNNHISQIPANLLASVFNFEEYTTFMAPEDADSNLLSLRFD